MRIAVDAMGGDFAPGPIVQGAIEAVQRLDDVHIVLVGDRQQVEPLVAAAPREAQAQLDLVHCSQAIGMHEGPVVALRKKPDSSISRCWALMANGQVEAIVSAGNTGAMVAAGLMSRLFLKGVKRPGIGAVMPTSKGLSLIIDCGANMNAKPEHLFQYGVMGSVYAQNLFKIDSPTVGLMNVGTEEQKGSDLHKETRALFKASSLKPRFVGNIEGRDLHQGVCDVVVCDGYVGNVILKVSEGLAELMMRTTHEEVRRRLPDRAGEIDQAFRDLHQRFEYSEFGGAPLLGIAGICIICHGASDRRAIRNAIRCAASQAHARINEQIVAELRAAARATVGDPAS